ncbi:hypothetical protein BHE90_010152 [Fusarium euwallaceae]|uniref:Protein kinase domain-containing protein n=2 Tax=Fusarium solani species complex TaxID=232080 RepID=A0A430LI22_9HYPO|nr:hypothetical protein CEP51_014758 [Fusarium floridanum]RTE75378.1 hypothetical protein BHE90_010152 [Fusarium euwallaceae]
MDDFEESPNAPRRIKFRLGHNIVSAIGTPNDRKHHNVLRLSIIRSPLQRTLMNLLLLLPIFLQVPIAAMFPGFFLPDRLVLKKAKEGWLEEFENEKLMYERLQSLQGRVIPRLYGEAECEGARALILSEITGIMPWEQKLPPLQADQFKELVETAFRELNALGLAYDDVKLDNLILVQDRVVLVDLESVYEPSSEQREYVFNSDRIQLEVVYQRYLDNCYDDDDF